MNSNARHVHGEEGAYDDADERALYARWWWTSTSSPTPVCSTSTGSATTASNAATTSRRASDTSTAHSATTTTTSGSNLPSSLSTSLSDSFSNTASSNTQSNSATNTLQSLTTTTDAQFTTSISSTATMTSSALGTTGSATSDPSSIGTLANAQNTVCLGDGLDSTVDGLLSTLVLTSVVGLLIWLLFATLRPRFRQVYGLREWFVSEETRPKPLRNTFWAFLFPPVPLVPSVSKSVDHAGQSAGQDAEIFPSDEQLAQRTLWHAFRIVLGWTILGLAAAIPLYLVNTPCLQFSSAQPTLGGQYSTLNDLSLLRLLRLLEDDSIRTTTVGLAVRHLAVRTIVNGTDYFWRARIRIIVLVAILIVLGVLPALYKLLKEYHRLAKYRRRWTDVHLEGLEMAWINARNAPGFAGWGEMQIKEFIHRTGLGSTLLGAPQPRTPGHSGEEAFPEIDIERLYTISDTTRLDFLVAERDAILEQLEMAETKYINSFTLTSPEASIEDLQRPMPDPAPEGLPHISRPRPLQPRKARRRKQATGSSNGHDYAPVSYVAPSRFYQVSVPSVSNSGSGRPGVGPRQPSFTDSVNQRVIGTRFQEMSATNMNRSRSRSLLGFPLGPRVRASGEHFRPVSPPEPIPDPTRYGPNFIEGQDDETTEPTEGEEWVDVGHEAPIDFSRPSPVPGEDISREPSPPPDMPSSSNGHGNSKRASLSSTFKFIRRPKIFGPTPSEQRESIPLRPAPSGAEAPPPHLRLQRAPPFVRPLTGFDHDALGEVYADIRAWRTRLKAVNADVEQAQAEAYASIGEGKEVKGWILVGRGLRYLPGVQLFEGRSKEDVRWDVLQLTPGQRRLRWLVYWLLVFLSGFLLTVGLAAAAGLALAPVPNFAHYVPFLGALNNDNFTSGLATVLAPAVGATLFILAALSLLQWASRFVATISVSAGELLMSQTAFYVVLVVAVMWLVTAGALIFAMHAFAVIPGGDAGAVADGSIYISILVLAIVLNFAFIAPGLLMLQPIRLRRVLRTYKASTTPRQRFRALYPRPYSAVFALSCAVLAFTFASTFSLIFPLIGPAICVLLLLTLIAHRYLVGYVYGRTLAQTGGILQLWLTKRFASVLALQPFLMGLELLTRRLWPEAGTLLGSALVVVLLVEALTFFLTRHKSARSLHPVTREALASFVRTARPRKNATYSDGSISAESSHRNGGPRGSYASVLDMMNQTLATPSNAYQTRSPVPLQTEAIDDLTQTEFAARTHPDAPPRLPALPWTAAASGEGQMLYAPVLLAPPPAIWLPDDPAGVARGEAFDLERYHGLHAVLDVRSVQDKSARRRSAAHG